jgi:hypothetical protein
MSLVRRGSPVLCAALFAACAFSAFPRPAAAADQPRVEVTPYYAWRTGGDFNIDVAGISGLEIKDGEGYGLILSFNVDPHGQVDVQYSEERTELQAHGSGIAGGHATLFDLNVKNWQVGGNYAWSEPEAPVRGYVGFSVGWTTFDPVDSGFDGDSLFAFSFYGGAKVHLSKHLGLRLQAQWVATRISSSSDVFCSSQGFCYVTSDGEYLDQFEAGAGLTFKF